MYTDERAGHRRVAGQEERLALLDEAGEAVADRVVSKVWSVVADTNLYHCRLICS